MPHNPLNGNLRDSVAQKWDVKDRRVPRIARVVKQAQKVRAVLRVPPEDDKGDSRDFLRENFIHHFFKRSRPECVPRLASSLGNEDSVGAKELPLLRSHGKRVHRVALAVLRGQRRLIHEILSRHVKKWIVWGVNSKSGVGVNRRKYGRFLVWGGELTIELARQRGSCDGRVAVAWPGE